jgi:choline-glycine betaine transporter
MTTANLFMLLFGGGIVFILFIIFVKPITQRIDIGGQYRPPDDEVASVWRSITYLVMLTCSLLFFMIAEIPSPMLGFEVVVITFGFIVLWEVRVDLISGTTAPLSNAAHIMKHPWDRDVEPLLYWLAILFNLGMGISIVYLGSNFLWTFLRDLPAN